jgi:cell wall-associated NlpC family hydrolase
MAVELYRENRDDDMYPRTRRGRLRPSLAYRRKRARLLIGLAVAASAVTGGVLGWTTGPAAFQGGHPQAAVSQLVTRAVLAASTESVGARILDRAETRTGDWYSYGAAGPSFFDCSGLVYWAATSIGERSWPRTTFGLIGAVLSGRFVYTSHPQRGDLAFYGSGHVELVTIWYHTTFGALNSGTRVGWHHYDPRYWGPTFYLHPRW